MTYRVRLKSIHEYPKYGYVIWIETKKWPWSKWVIREFVGEATVWHETTNGGKRPDTWMEGFFANLAWNHKYRRDYLKGNQ